MDICRWSREITLISYGSSVFEKHALQLHHRNRSFCLHKKTTCIMAVIPKLCAAASSQGHLLPIWPSEDTKMQNILPTKIFFIKLEYLCDIFEKLNSLNHSLQGKDMHLLKATEKISAFIKKTRTMEKKIEWRCGQRLFFNITTIFDVKWTWSFSRYKNHVWRALITADYLVWEIFVKMKILIILHGFKIHLTLMLRLNSLLQKRRILSNYFVITVWK